MQLKTLAEALESTERTDWVDFYTDDAIFVGPGCRRLRTTALLDIALQISISSMEIVAQSTLAQMSSRDDRACDWMSGEWLG